MLSYKSNSNRKVAIKEISKAIGKDKGIGPYKLIKTVIRVHHFFNCIKLRDKSGAFFYCNISFSEFWQFSWM